ncbi:hypothetical protein [Solimicrobium silvestre]|uniref:Uncharacterized protein n=1 Tax=Solimicrobium silvestre TaxID=2099400 RepID=A0A2S9H086_9BURK|nr:hypothetical protein [Solimicrobium silvestre]PRC93395.1 hypothetical protein S2091_1782 [Solimicrobium silvestre]
MNKSSQKFGKKYTAGMHDRADELRATRPQLNSIFRKRSLLAMLTGSAILYGCGGGNSPADSSAAAVGKTEARQLAAASSTELTATSSDAGLQSGFNQAVTEARLLNFTDANYPFLLSLGWPTTDSRCAESTMVTGYLAGIQNRCAYYSRDYVHQATGAYYLGMYEQNYQMAYHFATILHNNSGALAPYWAIGANGNEYEQNDESPAPFEIGQNIANMYRLTADSRYLGSAFSAYINNINNNFSNINNNQYINADGFRMARLEDGEAATYNEFVSNAGVPPTTSIVLGGDMAASEIAYYRGVSQYPAMQASGDTTNMAGQFNTLSSNFNSHWYLGGAGHFSVALTGVTGTTYSSANYASLTYYDHYAQEPNLFPLYKGIITDPTALANQATYVDSNAEAAFVAAGNSLQSPGVESHTYLPTAFYNANMPDTAWKWLTRLAAWQVQGGTSTYPEVGFALISDTITKVLGVDFDAPNNNLTTLANLPSSFSSGNYVQVSNIPIHNAALTFSLTISQTAVGTQGLVSTMLAFNTDPSLQPNGGVYWIPRFRTAAGYHCNVFSTFKNGTSRTDTFNLIYDPTTETYGCNADNRGIWLYAGDPNYAVTSMTVTSSI